MTPRASGQIIKGEHSETGIVILSSHWERQYLNLIGAEEASGLSYVLKQLVSGLGLSGADYCSGLVVMDFTGVNSMMPREI